jgi:glutathione reductase (NADPH)
MKYYDFFVIGGGSGGVRASRIAAAHGAKVGLAEGSRLGGTCVNLGCIPKKLMAYGADYAATFKESGPYGWTISSPPTFDWNTLIKAKDKEIERLNGIYKSVVEKPGAQIIHGFAEFLSPQQLKIGDETIEAKHILIATGGKPKHPDIPGGHLMAVSDDIFSLPRQPEKAVILGGGYIALEFAHILNGLGTDVHLIYYKDRLLRHFDADISTHLTEAMRKKGIQIHLNTQIESIEKAPNGLIVKTDTGQSLPCDLALAAIGRVGNTDSLQLAKAGISADTNGLIPVNAQYQTATPHIYALGDVTNTPHLTPVAIAEGHALADHLFGGRPLRPVETNIIPTAIFSDAPVGTAGMGEQEARANGIEIDCYRAVFTPLKHRITGHDEKTLMKLVVERASGKVIGCHMVGTDAPEIIQGFAVAMIAGATKADFDRTIAVHPTAAEEFVLMREVVS